MTKLTGILGAVALAASLSAHAQLTSVDGGRAVEDASGLMFANTALSQGSDNQLGGNGAQGLAWIASLNAEHYGGYSDWTIATGNSTHAANATTNQLGQLFSKDCTSSITCASFTAFMSALNQPASGSFGILVASSSVTGVVPGCSQFCGTSYYEYYIGGNFSTVSGDVLGFDVEPYLTTVLAVRDVAPAPELDVSHGVAALTLLCGAALLLKSRARRN